MNSLSELLQITKQWAERNLPESEFFFEISSTSDYAKQKALSTKNSVRLIAADSQTSGRGRRKNQWLNSQNSGDLFLSTWCFQVEHSPQPVLTPRLGFALYQALQVFGQGPNYSIKAPNDLFLESRKLAGLLVEVIEQKPRTEILIGLGLNVFGAPAIPEATSLVTAFSKFHIESLWPEFLFQLQKNFQEACQNKVSSFNNKEIQSLLKALNQNPNLDSPYTRLEPNGTLWQSGKSLPWHEL